MFEFKIFNAVLTPRHLTTVTFDAKTFNARFGVSDICCQTFVARHLTPCEFSDICRQTFNAHLNFQTFVARTFNARLNFQTFVAGHLTPV